MAEVNFISNLLGAKLVRRTETILLPDLKGFFPEGQEPSFTVQGLTGEELARTMDAAKKYLKLDALIDAIASPNAKEKVEAIKESLGITAKVPEEIAKRLEQLVLGSVNPKFTPEAALKFCECFPIEFYQLTTAIIRLTGRGHEPGKSEPSGTTKKSEQP